MTTLAITATATHVLDVALQAARQGISVIPILPHTPTKGDKRPAFPWKQYQHQPASLQQVTQWFQSDTYGLAVVCGKVSNNLVMVELEAAGADRLTDLEAIARDSGLGPLWDKITGGAFEQSPSGGYHWYVHVDLEDGQELPGNTKLAQVVTGGKRKVVAETRGEGGYSVIAPTPGRFHASGKPWQAITNHIDKAAHITLDEYETFTDLLRTLHQPAEPSPNMPACSTGPMIGGVRPGDDYESKTSWEDILTPHGWTKAFIRGTTTYWCRPGKTEGTSATTGRATDRDRLYVFTTSTVFEPETPYTKFGAYAQLNHGGDVHAAAKTLARDGYGKPGEHPRDTTGLDTWINQHATSQQADSTPSGMPALTIDEPDTYTRTDDGNAIRFADTYRNQLRYIPETSSWVYWTGTQWKRDHKNATAIEAARTLARNLPQDDKPDQAHRRRSLSKTGIDATVALASTMPGIYTPLTRFDADPYILNTPGGAIDLKTGQLAPPDPNILCLRSTTVTPDSTVPITQWDAFLAQTFAGNPELVTYVQRFLGMALIGKVKEQIFAFFNGAGANGKSTLLNTIQHILGTGTDGYSTTVQSTMFTKGAENRHPADIAALSGVRLAVTSETEEGQHFAEARVKLLTGSDLISARFMRQDFFTFTPTHTIVMISNYEPEVATGGSAFWRRVKKVPFNNVVPENQRDPHLEEKLLKEAPGILYWLIDGAWDYLQHGMEEPAAVRVATKTYEVEQDNVQMFIDEKCTICIKNRDLFQVPVSRVYSVYERWCTRNGYDAISKASFGRRLKRRGIESCVSNSVRYYVGLQVESNELEEALDG
ncbi:phage/plasmid primase, P4 family [Trueperella sp. LYQ141]|uniref:phage/plasmid primase, P4 family n=1 Tax=Trueperella sp. LYQ141 TaxID=3391058 RepID=UPI003983619E